MIKILLLIVILMMCGCSGPKELSRINELESKTDSLKMMVEQLSLQVSSKMDKPDKKVTVTRNDLYKKWSDAAKKGENVTHYPQHEMNHALIVEIPHVASEALSEIGVKLGMV